MVITTPTLILSDLVGSSGTKVVAHGDGLENRLPTKWKISTRVDRDGKRRQMSEIAQLLKLIEDNYLDPKRLAIFCKTRKNEKRRVRRRSSSPRTHNSENALVVFWISLSLSRTHSAIVRAAAKNWCVREATSDSHRDTNLYLNGVTAKRSTAKLVSSLIPRDNLGVRRAVKKIQFDLFSNPVSLTPCSNKYQRMRRTPKIRPCSLAHET